MQGHGSAQDGDHSYHSGEFHHLRTKCSSLQGLSGSSLFGCFSHEISSLATRSRKESQETSRGHSSYCFAPSLAQNLIKMIKLHVFSSH